MDDFASPLPIQADPPPLRGWVVDGLDHTALRLLLLAKAIERLNSRTMADLTDMTMAEWRVLSRLAPTDGATVRDISELAWSDRAEVSRAAATLRGRGLIDSRANPRDRRAPILFCTAEGLREYRRIIPWRNAYYAEITSDLDPAERLLLDDALLRISRRLTRMGERGG